MDEEVKKSQLFTSTLCESYIKIQDFEQLLDLICAPAGALCPVTNLRYVNNSRSALRAARRSSLRSSVSLRSTWAVKRKGSAELLKASTSRLTSDRLRPNSCNSYKANKQGRHPSTADSQLSNTLQAHHPAPIVFEFKDSYAHFRLFEQCASGGSPETCVCANFFHLRHLGIGKMLGLRQSNNILLYSSNIPIPHLSDLGLCPNFPNG